MVDIHNTLPKFFSNSLFWTILATFPKIKTLYFVAEISTWSPTAAGISTTSTSNDKDTDLHVDFELRVLSYDRNL